MAKWIDLAIIGWDKWDCITGSQRHDLFMLALWILNVLKRVCLPGSTQFTIPVRAGWKDSARAFQGQTVEETCRDCVDFLEILNLLRQGNDIICTHWMPKLPLGIWSPAIHRAWLLDCKGELSCCMNRFNFIGQWINYSGYNGSLSASDFYFAILRQTKDRIIISSPCIHWAMSNLIYLACSSSCCKKLAEGPIWGLCGSLSLLFNFLFFIRNHEEFILIQIYLACSFLGRFLWDIESFSSLLNILL